MSANLDYDAGVDAAKRLLIKIEDRFKEVLNEDSPPWYRDGFRDFLSEELKMLAQKYQIF